MLRVYADFAENHMAMPVIMGEKTAGERFPGAVSTLCIEAMMQDRKALQAGTSHFMGQNFAKSCNIQFTDESGELGHAWTTSWGVSTRLIGGLIMTHADDDGMVLPPRLAPAHVAILPVMHKAGTRGPVLEACRRLAADLRAIRFGGRPIEVELDERDLRGGEKLWSWIKKGIPLTVELGPRDLENDTVYVGRRDEGPRARQSLPRTAFLGEVAGILQAIQDGLLARARAFREEHTRTITDKEAFYAFFTPRNPGEPEAHGGFARTPFAGGVAEEERIAKDLKVTVRCVPLEDDGERGTCPFTGKADARYVYFAKSY